MRQFHFTTSTGGGGNYISMQPIKTAQASGRYKPSGVDFVKSFYAVLQRWQSETAFSSDPIKKASHPSFKAMVNNAELVTPLIIEELRSTPSPLFWVLEEAFKTYPYADEHIGDIEACSNAWIDWYSQDERCI